MKVKAKAVLFQTNRRIRPGEEFELKDESQFNPTLMERVGTQAAEKPAQEGDTGFKPAPKPAPKAAPKSE